VVPRGDATAWDIYIYMYMYICIYIHTYIYLYIYIESVREREMDREWGLEVDEALQSKSHPGERERVLYWHPTGPNPLHHRDDFSRPALRHGSLNSLFQVAYLPRMTCQRHQ